MAVKTKRYTASQLIESGVLVINDGFRAKNSQLNKIDGLPFARAGNINNGFDFSEADLVIEEEVCKAGIKISQPGDVVFTSKGTVGRFGFVTQDIQKFVYSPQLCFWRVLDESVINPRFLYYWMHSSEFLSQVHALKGQTDMADYVSLKDQRAMEIRLPDRKAQDDIAEVIGAIDNKIQLNRQTNQTLESMAQALFKSWFVDFDPVIDNALAAGNEIPEPLAAKATARRALREQGADKANQPHTLPEHIRQLFPSRFQFTEELGWIPEGWQVTCFGDVAQHVREGVAAREIAPNELYVGLEHIDRKHLFLENSGRGADVESNKSRFQKGDLLFGKLRPYFHKVALTNSGGVCSTDILVFRAKDGAYNSYMALTAYREDFVAHANACSTGTRMPRASAKDMLAYEIVKPPYDVVKQFEAVASPMWKKGHTGVSETMTLAEVRDALLPKLLSGELRIPEAEKELEEALA